MRGEICIGSASFLSSVALLLLVFLNVGQINTSTVPRGISMVQVNMSGYGDGLHVAFSDPIDGLYTDNATAPLAQQKGVRQVYKFGLYSYCAFGNSTQGICSNTTAGQKFEPLTVIEADMLANYTVFTNAILTTGTFIDSSYLSSTTHAAYYLIIIGTAATVAALLTGFLKHTLLFLLSTVFAIIGAVALLIGATIWTVVLKKVEDINNFNIVGSSGGPTAPLGITVSTGNGISLLWAAWVCIVLSIFPYMMSCCTYRG